MPPRIAARMFRTIVTLLLLGATGPLAQAQLYRVVPERRDRQRQTHRRFDERSESDTRLSVELLIGRRGAAQQIAQWRPVFRKVGVPIRIHRNLTERKPSVDEREIGPLRVVKIVGKLDSRGRLVFPGRSFTRRETDKLKEWLRELKTYGAQGAPDGKPLWGLNKPQFDGVYKALSTVVPDEVHDRPLSEALDRLPIPDEYPLRLSSHAREHLQQNGIPPVRKRVKGTSLGTALALLLSDYGLGFRPLRTPDGSIELVVDPRDRVKQVWPVGWEFKQSRLKTAPKLFQPMRVRVDDEPLLDVLETVSSETGIPIHMDYDRIAERGIELDELRVSYPPRQASWSQVIRGVTVPNRLRRRYRIDEQGQPFVWITTLQTGMRTIQDRE